MHTVDGDNEAQAVSGGDLAATPVAGQADTGLVVDQAAVGSGQGVGPEVVLAHPGQPAPVECRPVGPGDRFKAGVAGLGQQYRADAGPQVLGSRGTPADMGELGVEAGPGGNL